MSEKIANIIMFITGLLSVIIFIISMYEIVTNGGLQFK